MDRAMEYTIVKGTDLDQFILEVNLKLAEDWYVEADLIILTDSQGYATFYQQLVNYRAEKELWTTIGEDED